MNDQGSVDGILRFEECIGAAVASRPNHNRPRTYNRSITIRPRTGEYDLGIDVAAGIEAILVRGILELLNCRRAGAPRDVVSGNEAGRRRADGRWWIDQVTVGTEVFVGKVTVFTTPQS